MRIDIVTIFPDMFKAVLDESIIKRAQNKKKVKIYVHNLRDYTQDKHKKVDDRPFGGGPGMVMNAQPFFDAVESIKKKTRFKKNLTRVVLLSPKGRKLTQKVAMRYSHFKHIIMLCGHYEGIDNRVSDYLIDEEVSIGDYVLTGGELPAMVLLDSLVRLIPGVLGDKKSLIFESFQGNLLEYPQYTRPANYAGMKVPSVLLSGKHNDIESWRKKKSLEATRKKRPDLLKNKYFLRREK